MFKGLFKLDIGIIIGVINEANDNDFINIFVFDEPVRFTKEKNIVDIDERNNTLGIYTKSGRVKETIIDVDSIKYINRVQPAKFGVDPRDM